MKNAFLPLIIIGFLFVSLFMFVQTEVDSATLEKKLKSCPKESDLVETSIDNQEELVNELDFLIPDTYIKGDEYGENYKEWIVTTVMPLPKTVDDTTVDVYYEIAKNLCGKEVANKSWLIQIDFPKWDDVSASNSEGQIFVAKNKETGWYVWYRYH
ncbi:hypothetical protein [Paenisporosarcina indica]|uniref:hypothetical protein n=1 Tax=Paenisporosarcina indica TaxID=650093 RepID=UPI0009FD67FC|nr:hypothetical protein [Paenisporosarcina indica]